MKEYRVYFSFYSEQNGDFEEAILKVEAENQFEARRLAWEMSDKTDEFKFASNVRICGIDWNASPLDMEDYFNAAASYEKYRLKYIENVELPNARISNNEQSRDYYERHKYEHYGSIGAIFSMAMVFGKPFGMKPPTVCEELHYAREFLNLIYDDYDKYSAFLKKIEKAEKWDSAALYDIRDSFKYGRFRAGEYEYDFSQQYSKDGIYPDRADLKDSDFTYIYRWENQHGHKHMAYLPFFGEKDIIVGSQEMQYDSVIAGAIMSVVFDNKDKPELQNFTDVYHFVLNMCKTENNDMLAAGMSGFIAVSIYAATGNTTLCVLIVLITVAASVMALSKDQSNQSIIDQVRFMARFMKTQRKFPYYYKQEWSD